MNTVTRVKLDMAARVRDFIRAHPTEASEEGIALARLEELLARGDALADQQRAGFLAVRTSTLKRQELRHRLQHTLLRYLVSVGTVAARGNAALLTEFKRLDGSMNHRAFLSAVRGMLAKAETFREGLIEKGMSPSLLEDLQVAVTELGGTLEASREGRRDHVGASAELRAIGQELVEATDILDGLVRYRFGEDTELMAAWASARNVFGPVRHRGPLAPEAGESGAEGGVSSAA